MRRNWGRSAIALAVGLGAVLVVANVTGAAPVPTGPLGSHEAAEPDRGGMCTLKQWKRSRKNPSRGAGWRAGRANLGHCRHDELAGRPRPCARCLRTRAAVG